MMKAANVASATKISICDLSQKIIVYKLGKWE